MSPRDMIRAHAYPALAFLSTFSLVFIAFSLYPLGQWARTQNDCIERTFRSDGSNNAGIPSKVWSCNGGGN